ncbi:low molecular weight protein-tyrosine-phosphatase [Shewanella psychrotolerans]|uniref:low molecular weight protein-tyrosine-phosphatase n=1 Tax=Shewanella psychrotolerans TaxID=2864206 RepID=UPI001C65DACC|nr:low molecular weight protein-tyrosine-phosphatase [Shewanella psychrotolerans]QYK00137.1 low molecular weight phosphotyrosine protein phosphatase [Shewanella psychrotolerans]
MTQTTSVLFVCLGNICRSPTAEAVLRTKATERGLAVECDSAGTSAAHIGEAPDGRAMQAGKRRGIDFSGITARQVCDNDFIKFDMILAADRANLHKLRERCPTEHQHKLDLILSYGNSEYSEVPDPYYGGENGFELVLDLIEQSCDGILAQISLED